MTHKLPLLTAFGLATSTAAYATSLVSIQGDAAPQAPDGAQYCLRVEAPVGTRIESVVCRTRAEWADWDVDVDKEWAREGVRVIEA